VSHTYDSFGNRLAQATSNVEFPAGQSSACNASGTLYQNVIASYSAQNQMTWTNAPGYAMTPSYDAAGDVSADGRNQYLYDAEGRICAVSGSYGMTGYLYDAAGNRVAKGTVRDLRCCGLAPTAEPLPAPSPSPRGCSSHTPR
jgi:hypothetical protein